MPFWFFAKMNFLIHCMCLVYIQVKLTKISYIGILFKVWFIQDPFYSGFGLDRFIQDSVLFRVQFRQIYTGLHFIQGSV